MILARVLALALLLVPAQAVAREAPRALEDLRVLSSDAFEGRAAGTEGGAKARTYIVERFDALNLAPGPRGRLHAFTFAQGGATIVGTNVLATMRGAELPDEVLLVTAHYDHLGRAGGEINNGADDNASGVAAMLALAESMTRTPPRRTIVFAALDAEEMGLRGAQALAESLDGWLAPARVRVVLNLDMVARADDGLLFAVGPRHYPFLKPILDGVPPRPSVRLAYGHDGGNPEEQDWTFASDHGAFHRRGVPFVYLGVSEHADYHSPSDDFARIDPAVFSDALGLIEDVARALDAADLPDD